MASGSAENSASLHCTRVWSLGTVIYSDTVSGVHRGLWDLLLRILSIPCWTWAWILSQEHLPSFGCCSHVALCQYALQVNFAKVARRFRKLSAILRGNLSTSESKRDWKPVTSKVQFILSPSAVQKLDEASRGFSTGSRRQRSQPGDSQRWHVLSRVGVELSPLAQRETRHPGKTRYRNFR